jgi:hypothetical protein
VHTNKWVLFLVGAHEKEGAFLRDGTFFAIITCYTNRERGEFEDKFPVTTAGPLPLLQKELEILFYRDHLPGEQACKKREIQKGQFDTG